MGISEMIEGRRRRGKDWGRMIAPTQGVARMEDLLNGEKEGRGFDDVEDDLCMRAGRIY